MTELHFSEYVMPAASLGEDSALADIHVNSYIRAPIAVGEHVSAEDGKYIGKGMISTLLPYRISDGYDRKRTDRAFFAAVLENECMRAVFLPELGGRLWSLVDKRSGRELLYKNDVLQPANLALRNAWFSGGVEWNVGIKGHNPLTAAPLFTRRAKNKNGDDVLRMYEYERIRGVVYLIEATLREDALLVNVTIENRQKKDVYMYWWSNIAVPETSKTRVLAPADEAFYCAYTDGGYFLDKAAMPVIEGRDITYAVSSPRSRDFFFDIPDERDKWVAALDENGDGLLQLSDAVLCGRKLFVWGNHTGGRHWNEWLSDKAGPYVEIQAGLLKTQMEHFPMAAESRITWQECYTAVSLDPKTVHGDFKKATDAVDCISKEKKTLLSSDAFAIVSEEPIALCGSGWGAIEERLRGEPISATCEFSPDSIGAAEAEWLALLGGKPLPTHTPAEPTPSYVVGDAWLSLLSAREERDFYWENQLGILLYAKGDTEGARAAFARSYALTPNAWALRNLAMIEKNIDGDAVAASLHLKEALGLAPDYRPLAVECGETFLRAGLCREWIALYEKMPEPLRDHGRIRMLVGAAYARIGEPHAAAKIIRDGLVVDDIKEGEYALSSIWLEIYRAILAKERGVAPEALTDSAVLSAYPLPRSLDFRMH